MKATFLYKFAAFIDWPPASFDSTTSPLTICILGVDPVAALIDEAASGQHVGKRPIAVRHLQQFTGDTRCHVLYLAASVPTPADVINTAHTSSVLTIVDSERIASARGIISFVVKDNRVRFDIDAAMAAESGLIVSSKLLSLARVVRPAP